MENATPEMNGRPPMSQSGEPVAPATSSLWPQPPGYRIVRLIDEGGMGTVYEAWQEKPHRRVALKVLRAGLLTPRLLRRFSLEVDILGRLEHPAIARIYEAGSWDANGQIHPYFAMEFIEGAPITNYARLHLLGTRDRIALLIKVVEGVHYAHQKGIIHRDLKPANIAVDAAGQPRILDFGVARILDVDQPIHTLTLDTGGVLGTLAYMPPEQAGSQNDPIDVRSDIYALGVVAFELLSGERPHQFGSKTLHDAIRVIHEQEPRRLGAVVPSLRGDLEIIVHKAMEKDKARRYASAAALGDDLLRFLNDEPIVARPPSAWYQMRKFARRHKALVGAGAAVVTALALGLAAASIALMRTRQAEQVAVLERERAETNLRKALDTVDQFTTLIARGPLAHNPDAAPVRDQLLRDAVSFYEQLAADNTNDERLREELSWSLTLLAAARREAGDLYESRALHEERIARLQALHARYPDSPYYQRDMARSWEELARLDAELGDISSAISAQERAGALFQQLVRAFPDHVDYRREWARNWDERGLIYQRAGDWAAAQGAVEQALKLKQTLAREFPDDPEFTRAYARSWDELGKIHARFNRYDDAEQALEQATRVKRELTDRHPAQIEYRRDEARSWDELGKMRLSARRYDEAVEALERSLAIKVDLVKRHPRDPDFLRDLAITWSELGKTHAQREQHQQALHAFEEAYDVFNELAAGYPGNSDYLRDLARNYSERGRLYDRAGDRATAQALFKESHERYLRLVANAPNSRSLRMDLAYMLGFWSNALRGSEAQQRLEDARRIWLQLAREYPKDDGIRRSLTWTELRISEVSGRTPEPVSEDGAESAADVLLPAPDRWHRPFGPAEPTDTRQPTAATDPLDAHDIELLKAHAGQSVAVRGTILTIVLQVGRTELSFLQFGTTRGQFTGVIHRNALAAFTTIYGERLDDLAGTEVELEGIVSVFNGTPQIVLNRPEQIRVLAEPDTRTASRTDIPTLSARAMDELRSHEGRQVVVEGMIRNATAQDGGMRTFLNFEKIGDEQLTGVIYPDRVPVLEAALGGDLHGALAGRTIRLSGRIYLHRGNPNIEIREPDQIEILPQ